MHEPLLPRTAPFRTHQLDVGDGHSLYVEECGRADGMPLVFLHGGPGSGCSPEHRRFFDPSRFRAVLFDQRGSGRSEPLGRLQDNTTAHLVADIEHIRAALGIERWLVFGGSWGSLLALAYAIRHPAQVAGLVLRGIFLGSDDELRSFVHGANDAAPLAWQDFAKGIPPHERDDLLRAYTARLLAYDAGAARRWLDYERALMGEAPLADAPDARRLAKTAIQAHYLSNGCFSDPDALLAGCAALRHLPVCIVQGRRDAVCPPDAARRLHRALPQAELIEVENGGHNALAPEMAAACIASLERLAGRAGISVSRTHTR
ncbi:prolyl aminopeptidase [Noviherbaspirillum autotrophicum]|uniref:prolyl aminopeptidase n=1 Tax=Noviherbaspirillum autotrophicum TaxID=709839 RepID=UPI000693ADCD|nr:prolyl aminopeptidase [Noviherbaspirillum autotrophicum]